MDKDIDMAHRTVVSNWKWIVVLVTTEMRFVWILLRVCVCVPMMDYTATSGWANIYPPVGRIFVYHWRWILVSATS